MNSTIELIKNHRSIREFQDKLLTLDQINIIIEAAQSASTSNHVQAYSIIGVTDQKKKEEISILAGNQKHVANSGIFFVFCADLHRLTLAAKLQGIEPKIDYLELFLVTVIDTSLAAQNAMLAAESMGLGGVFVGGIRNNPEEIVNILGLPKLVIPLFGMSVGYPAHNPEMKPRLPVSAIYHENEYKSDHLQGELDNFDLLMNSYYQKRSLNAKNLNWTKSMASYLAEYHRLQMHDFITSRDLIRM